MLKYELKIQRQKKLKLWTKMPARSEHFCMKTLQILELNRSSKFVNFYIYSMTTELSRRDLDDQKLFEKIKKT